jgi:hypothetical protein
LKPVYLSLKSIGSETGVWLGELAMGRRLFSLVMALVVMSAPLAADLCRIKCEKPVRTLAQHSCHDGSFAATPVQAGKPVMKSLPHTCDHDAATELSAPSTLPAAIWVRIEARVFADASQLPPSSHGLRHVPPLLQVPLRV